MSWINVSVQTINPVAHNPEGFLNYKFPKDEWRYFLKELKCSYSPCHYNKESEKGFYYRNDNNAVFGSVNALMLDFDDGMTIEEALKIFSNYDGIVATTRSHQKEKNGKINDRFRVIIPAKEAISLSKNEYKELMSNVMEIYPQADPACKNISRFYFSNQDSEIFMLDGVEKFDWRSVYDKAQKLKEIERRRKSLHAAPQREATITFDGEKIDYIRSISKTNKMLDLLKFDRFASGGRNNYLFSVASYFKEIGMSDSEIEDNVMWMNAQGDGINEREIRQTIFRSLRIEA